ncbi:MAG: thioredoxin [Peptococcaceae bacterium]|nr:thioredoxin [Peptococcaceae bacterium]
MNNLPLITGEQYEQITKENKETCIVIFSKETCSVCKQLAPIAEKIASQFEGQVNFYTMDVKTPDGLATFKSLQLMGVPQSVFVLNGEVQQALPGAISESIFKKEINEMLNPKKGILGKIKGLFGK